MITDYKSNFPKDVLKIIDRTLLTTVEKDHQEKSLLFFKSEAIN